MNKFLSHIRKKRGVHWWVSASLIFFVFMMLSSLVFLGLSSQYLLEHKFWLESLQSISADHTQRVQNDRNAPLPHTGLVQSWYIEGERDGVTPDYLAELPLGYYSSESGDGTYTTSKHFDGRNTFHALIVEIPPGRLITVIDISQLEKQQNLDALISMLWTLAVAVFILGVIVWLHANLVRPMRHLAHQMQAIDPEDPSARLPTTYEREEIHIIAQASNAYLSRVEQFIERERGLLDQASHEFRTPIAVISGAVDVLNQMGISDAAIPALQRIENATANLSETMVALLYLSREENENSRPADVTVLHDLLPRLMQDHEHLLRDKSIQLTTEYIQATFIAAPEAMVRIAVSNLIRNAIENTDDGFVSLSLRDGIITISDSGSGFDPDQAAQRYRDSLQQSAPARGQGMGIFLISRICDRFGWELDIHVLPVNGTRATLNVGNSVIVL